MPLSQYDAKKLLALLEKEVGKQPWQTGRPKERPVRPEGMRLVMFVGNDIFCRAYDITKEEDYWTVWRMMLGSNFRSDHKFYLAWPSQVSQCLHKPIFY